jgi:outer membrane lipoprotein LolB
MATLLASCASLAPSEQAAVASESILAAPFEIQGRMSAHRGREGGAAGFVWTHHGRDDQVQLATPLGQTLAQLTGNAQGVRAQWPDGRIIEARDWDALTERVLGVPVPVAGLSAWLRGYARPATASSVERDAQGRPAILHQDGWQIDYSYADDTARRASRLTLRYTEGEPAEVRLVIDRWQSPGAN